MPANVILFKDYPSLLTKPLRLYCDANFLITLLFYHDNAANQTKITAKENDCFQFFNLIKQNNSELVTSVYGFSELMHFYFFWYGSDGMYQVVNNFIVQKKITLPSSVNSIHNKYKYFINNYPTEFLNAFNKISHRIAKAEEFLKQAGVKVLYPLPSPHLTNISMSIVEYAAILLDAFPKLESNDAMHLAIADYLNVPCLISLDEAYKDIDGFTILTYS
ncbi:MAG: PIN domain-containing protein [Nitrospiraceae bacterium]|nr:PIN domain-containing protein [Nitrospiraceae bacterium]